MSMLIHKRIVTEAYFDIEIGLNTANQEKTAT